jgi:hypothetical protein
VVTLQNWPSVLHVVRVSVKPSALHVSASLPLQRRALGVHTRFTQASSRQS